LYIGLLFFFRRRPPSVCALKVRAKTPSQFARQILSALTCTGEAIVVIKYFEFIIEMILLYIKSIDIFILLVSVSFSGVFR
jgi:hypothetical protein